MPTTAFPQVHLVAGRREVPCRPRGGGPMEGWGVRMGGRGERGREEGGEREGGREGERRGRKKRECKSKCRFVDTVRRACWLTG